MVLQILLNLHNKVIGTNASSQAGVLQGFHLLNIVDAVEQLNGFRVVKQIRV